MRLTKYPQSCVLVEETDGGRVLIDPGTFVTEAYDLDDFGAVDAVLYTHRHPDHFDRPWTSQLLDAEVPIYAHPDVCGQIRANSELIHEVVGGDVLEVADFEVRAHHLPHVPLVDGSPGPPNLGFVFDDRLLHPGDSITAANISVDTLAVPIVGSSISFRDAYVMLRETGAARTVPIHYDFFLADPHLFADFCDIAKVVVLDNGESTEV